MGILPVLKNLMETKNMKYREISLSILWSLAFDERNNDIIQIEFSKIISNLKNDLDYQMYHCLDEISERQNDYSTNPEYISRPLLLKSSNKLSIRSLIKKLNFLAFGKQKLLKNNSEFRVASIPEYLEKMSSQKKRNENNGCKKILDGLLWTLRGNLMNLSFYFLLCVIEFLILFR